MINLFLQKTDKVLNLMLEFNQLVFIAVKKVFILCSKEKKRNDQFCDLTMRRQTEENIQSKVSGGMLRGADSKARKAK